MFKKSALTTAIALAGSIWTYAALAETPVDTPIQVSHQIGKISDWMGKQVKDQQGNEVGEITDFAVNLEDSTIRYVVVELDGLFNSKRIAVPLSALSPVPGNDKTLSLAASDTQWKAAETFGSANWPATATLAAGQAVTASTALRPAQIKPPQTLSDQDREFQNMDHDGDGFLSAAEIQSREGLSVTRDSDTNHDGRIDRAEFSAFELAEREHMADKRNAGRNNQDDEGKKGSGDQ